jgi:oxygen-independent coproporphyrinogen-3 oxidase
VGLGASSISDTWDAFAQNEKEVEAYQVKISQGQWPLVNGHLLSKEDLLRRQVILDLMCRGEVMLPETLWEEAARNLGDALQDGLVEWEAGRLKVTAQGRALVRNISAGFDQYIHRTGHGQPVFSRAV